MRVLVTGAGGQLGHDVAASCTLAGDDVVALDRRGLDITDRRAVLAAIGRARPDVVVNCAAFTAVDRCEHEVDTAHAVNATGVGHVAEAVRAVGAHLVHLSTDYVFDGRLDRPYREGDRPNPQSVYGRSKLAGERAAGPGAAIVRTSWVCGEHGSNMVRTVLALLGTHEHLAFVDDQRGCPTFTADLAPHLRWLGAERATGVFHLTNAGPVSWYDFVREILGAAGHDPDRVRPISTADLDPPRAAPRPANGVLDNARWRAIGRRPLRDFREPLSELVARLTPDPAGGAPDRPRAS